MQRCSVTLGKNIAQKKRLLQGLPKIKLQLMLGLNDNLFRKAYSIKILYVKQLLMFYTAAFKITELKLLVSYYKQYR